MKVDIKIKDNKAICKVVLEPSRVIYQEGNRGPILDYENLTVVKLWRLQEQVQSEIGNKYIIESLESGPAKIHNKDNSDRSGTWIFNIKPLTTPKKTSTIKKDVSKTRTKTRKKSSKPKTTVNK